MPLRVRAMTTQRRRCDLIWKDSKEREVHLPNCKLSNTLWKAPTIVLIQCLLFNSTLTHMIFF